MRIGVPKEIKTHEYRVGLVPFAVRELVNAGHEVLVEGGAGLGIGAGDDDYIRAGARIVAADELFDDAELIIKVKEPQPGEWRRLREGQILFTYLHLAADRAQAQGLLEAGVTAIAYETVVDERGRLPLLAPMSEVAGRLSIGAAGEALKRPAGGSGVLIGGVPGVEPAHVVILGGGVVGTHAARMAVGLGAQVTILDTSIDRLRELDELFGGRVRTLVAFADTVAKAIASADVVIGAVLVPGANAPRLVTRAMLETMRQGAVIVDVAIDQGGCFESSHPTTHADPIFVEQGIVHYCVANMPGAVPRTSSIALANATLPYCLMIADGGIAAIARHYGLRAGLNVHRGEIFNPAVAASLGFRCAQLAAA